jgi:hypothetical protein
MYTTLTQPRERDACGVVYYEEIKGELKIILIYECRCDERLRTTGEGSTRLTYTKLCGGLEHLKIETRLRLRREV